MQTLEPQARDQFERMAAEQSAACLQNNRGTRGYAKALRRGFPLAAGVIEGVCREKAAPNPFCA